MKKFLFLLVNLILMFNVSAKDSTPEFQDTIGIRDYIISYYMESTNITYQEEKEYIIKTLNKYIDEKLPILYKKIHLYDKLANEYNSLSDNDNKLNFLKINKLKIVELGFRELTIVEEGNKVFNPKSGSFSRFLQLETIKNVSETTLEKITKDLEDYIIYYGNIAINDNSIFNEKWYDFIKGFRKFGLTENEAIELANLTNLYEDSNGYVKYYKPQQKSISKKKIKRNNHKK